MRAVGERRALQNGHMREAIRMRMGCSAAPEDATCQLQHQQHEGGEPKPCGQQLMRGGVCAHPLECDAAAARLRPHRAVTVAVGRGLRGCGAEVDYERHVPHLYTWDEEKQRYTEAILDVVSVFPGDAQQRCYDITISSPHAQRVKNTWRRAGASARAGESRKKQRYGPAVRPLAFESYGRLGPGSQAALWRAAQEAHHYGRAEGTARQLVQRWRADMELALLYAQADAILAAKGALAHVAGARHYPIGRMVRKSRAAQGEWSEHLCST